MNIPEGLFEMVKSVVNGLAGVILFFITPKDKTPNFYTAKVYHDP